MLKSLRLRNLRGFTDDENSSFIDIKPITVLVGKNSSGKSSFIRSFPLLRQSIEAKTTGPMLWFGPYVDFGSFTQAVNKYSENDIVKFDFRISISSGLSEARTKYNVTTGGFKSTSPNRRLMDVDVSIGVSEGEKGKTVSKSLDVKYGGNTYSFSFGEDVACKLTINGQVYSDTQLVYFEGMGIFPTIGVKKRVQVETEGKKQVYFRFDESEFESLYQRRIVSYLKRFFNGNTKDSTISFGVKRLSLESKDTIYSELKRNFSEKTSFVSALNLNRAEIVDAVYRLNSHKNLLNIIKAANDSLESSLKQVRYIAPLRATAERFYRYQDLQVDEIDHTGSNLAMLLRSLSEQDYKEFSYWTMDNFGFRVRVEEEGLHYALLIQTDDSSVEFNINDMGFGFSQILPIVAALWFESLKRRFNKFGRENTELIFAIEQPELHLHPAYQAKLASVFVKIIQYVKKYRSETNVSIVFETHSKTMVDTLGEEIAEKNILTEDVAVIVFNKDAITGEINYRFSSFDHDGFLSDWPIGFFSGRL